MIFGPFIFFRFRRANEFASLPGISEQKNRAVPQALPFKHFFKYSYFQPLIALASKGLRTPPSPASA